MSSKRTASCSAGTPGAMPLNPGNRGSAAGQQAALEPGRHRRGTVVDAELGVDVRDMGLDRGLADEQAGGGLAVRAALRDQPQDVEFTLAERFPGWLPDLAEEPGGD